MESTNVPNAIIGGILVSLSYSIYQYTHSQPLRLSDIFWSLTILQVKCLPRYLPVISGIFFTSGVLFDCLDYEGVGSFNPYGSKDDILIRTSMYGFALGGFTIGIGAQLSKGDYLFHSLIEFPRGQFESLAIMIVMLGSAFFFSWLAFENHLTFLSNQTVNPSTEHFHYISANITIVISIILLIIAACLYHSKISDGRIITKKIIGSFLTGSLISLGFGICGLPTRRLFLAGITLNSNWTPQVIIFLSTAIVISIISMQLLKRTYYSNDIVQGESQKHKSKLSEVKPTSKALKIIGAGLFGLGWGISGLDIATFLIQSSIFTIPVVIIFGGFLILGSMIGNIFLKKAMIYAKK